MRTKYVAPSVSETAFNCPHCGALTTQSWSDLYGDPIKKEQGTPSIPSQSTKDRILLDEEIPADFRQTFADYFSRMEKGEPFRERTKSPNALYDAIHNLYLSECYNCGRFAVWVHQRMVFPLRKPGAAPGPDLPEHLVKDYEEARGVLDASPRAAAALLRLVIQKLCIAAGEKGRTLDDDVAQLMGKGLKPVTQQSLVTLRVIGKDAVPPGVLDLYDDRESASQLLELVNLMVEQLVSQPREVSAAQKKKTPKH